jgi:hypothetical protein
VTVRFGLAGTSYEVDLSQKNADKLAKIPEPYIVPPHGRAAAARAGREQSRPPGQAPRKSAPGHEQRRSTSSPRAEYPPG